MMKYQNTNRRGFVAGSTALSALGLNWPCIADAAVGTVPPPPPPPLSAFAKNPFIEDAALSPDAKTIAFLHNKGDQRILVIHDLATKKNKFIPSGDIKVRNIFFASPNHLIISTSQTAYVDVFVGGKDEYFSYLVFNLTTQKFWPLFSRMENYYPIAFGDINFHSRDGNHYITAKNVNRFLYQWELHEFNLDTEKNKVIDVEEEYPNWLFDKDGNAIAKSLTNDREKTWRLFIKENKTWKKILTEKYQISRPSLICFGEKPNELIVTYREGAFDGQYVRVNTDGSVAGIIPGGKDASNILIHPVTKSFAGLEFNSEWPEYQLNNPVLQAMNKSASEYYDGFRFKFLGHAKDIRKNSHLFRRPGQPRKLCPDGFFDG